jgi:hypothetical protein
VGRHIAVERSRELLERLALRTLEIERSPGVRKASTASSSDAFSGALAGLTAANMSH